MYNYRCPNCSILLSLPQNINEPKCPSCGHICKIEHDTIKDAPCQALGAYSQSNSIYNQYPKEPDLFENGQSGKSRGLAGLFAILLGWLGVHYFYVNKPTGGLLCILLTFITCGLWNFISLIQGIIILTMRQSEFEQKYINSYSSFPLF